jgi:hypothetical protein
VLPGKNGIVGKSGQWRTGKDKLRCDHKQNPVAGSFSLIPQKALQYKLTITHVLVEAGSYPIPGMLINDYLIK